MLCPAMAHWGSVHEAVFFGICVESLVALAIAQWVGWVRKGIFLVYTVVLLLGFNLGPDVEKRHRILYELKLVTLGHWS